MTPTEAKARVEKIRACAGDDEATHSYEDQLREDVLNEIARGTRHARQLASIALSTNDIAFARWCA